MHSLWARKTESFCGIDFSYDIGPNADPLSTNQITSLSGKKSFWQIENIKGMWE